jgi:predicted ArsR family transcriptional regulator
MGANHEPGNLNDQLSSIGSLQDPLRRSLYLYVASRDDEVSREEAAGAAGVQRQLAAFHLDKLVEAGLLETSYRRLSGRTGPGAGRPAKLYRRSNSEHAVSLPPRQYNLAAELLAGAVEEAGDRPAREALSEVANRFGRRLGEELRARLGPRASRERRMAALTESLDRYGYEPRREGPSVRLSNCPFHSLAEGHRDLVCGMNLNLVEGVVDGMGADDLSPCLDPKPGQCCVMVNSGRAKRA